MAAPYVLSPAAQQDIEDIWDYTESRWSAGQAEVYIRLLRQNIEAVAASPAIGRPCPEIRPGYHKHRAGSHVLFYRITDAAIDIIRILHERMDFERHF